MVVTRNLHHGSYNPYTGPITRQRPTSKVPPSIQVAVSCWPSLQHSGREADRATRPAEHANIRAPEDHINVRILQYMVS